MNTKKKSKIFVIDTSAVLSGKPINIDTAQITTTSGVSKELKPGGRDYRAFQFLKEKGLTIGSPSKQSLTLVDNAAVETGDKDRLSNADKEILALALDINKNKDKEAIVLTDDYSIQNLAIFLNIKYENISQSGITKKFKWIYQCRGCGKKFKENIKTCPICGAGIKNIISTKENIER
jgi:UPF0271 protein